MGYPWELTLERYAWFCDTHLRLKVSILEGKKWVVKRVVALVDEGKSVEGELELPDGRRCMLEYGFGAPRTTDPIVTVEQLAQFLAVNYREL